MTMKACRSKMPSLFCIEHALGDLFDARQEITEQVAFTDEILAGKNAALAEIDAAIVEYITAEVRKVDNISRLLIEWRVRRGAIEAERGRLGNIANAIERNEDRLKALVLQVMRDTGTKKLEGKIGTLRRQNNGGVPGVDVVQPYLVPESFKRSKTIIEPDLGKIREALESGVGVPGCRLRDRGEFLRVG